MTRFHWSRIVLAIVFAAALSVSPVWAEPQAAAPVGAFNQLWSLLAELWSEAGCIIDPHGGCGGGAAGSQAEAGCVADPHGGCGDAPTVSFAEAGCGIDPYGCPGTRNTPNADAGCGIDPHGGGCSR